MTILNGASLRDWDPAETKATYWAGAEDAFEGLERLQREQSRWVRRNSAVGDAFARKAGLL